MLRRNTRRLFDSWKDKTVFPRDQRGRFNLDEAASELGMEPNYVQALYKPFHYTFAVKGQRYPSEKGRVSRPGGAASSMNRMFPMYRRDEKLNRELRHVSSKTFSTF